MPSIESPEAIDLSSNGLDLKSATVRPLHHSILGKDYCFEIITSSVTRCFGCSSAGERQAWIEKIKRAINPNLDNSRRVEHQLSLYVQEAKGLPSKKKYFCEICLDRKLCARTTSKWKTDSSILWSEGFEFTCLPINEDITVHLYKDSDKKKKKDKDYIGLVNLPVKSLLNHNYVEKWYNLSTPSGNNKNKAGEAMAVRLKARFLSTKVLPTEQYKSFAEYLSHNYLHLCRTLGPSLTAQQKDELAKIMVNIMYATGSIKDYMTELVMDEVEKVEEESLIFRENTVGTKSVEAFLRLVGMRYLHKVFGEFITALFTTHEECEVDGSRLPAHANLAANQEHLEMSCSIAMRRVCESVDYFPIELREVFSIWNQRCIKRNRPRIPFRLVTASLFLRLLCPAILNPILFGLANEIPDTKTARCLTLVAKVVQNLANRSRFGSKEEYMQFMDAFVRSRWDDMTGFVDNVTNTKFSSLDKGFDGYIDLGKEFARLHSFFAELMPNLDAGPYSSLHPLPKILSDITELLESTTTQQTTKSTATTTSIHTSSIERTPGTLNSILEDAPLSNATETISHPGCSSTCNEPLNTAPQQHLAAVSNHAAGASSLMDLRDLTNGSAATEEHITSHHSGSHASLAQTTITTPSQQPPSSANNHEQHVTSASSCYDVRQPPTTTSKVADVERGLPLKFRNPIFNIQQRNTASAAPAPPSGNNDVTTPPHALAVGHATKSNKIDSKPPSGVSPVYPPTPLSFVNPLQQIHRQRQQQQTSTTSTSRTTNSNNNEQKQQIDSLESRTSMSSASTHPSSTNRKSSLGGTTTPAPQHPPPADMAELPVVIESTVRVSNAHLKTGLNQSSKAMRSKQTKPGESPTLQQQQQPRRKNSEGPVSAPSSTTSPSYPNMSLSCDGPMLELIPSASITTGAAVSSTVDHTNQDNDNKDGLVPAEAAATASHHTRIAANINSSNAVRGKTAKRTHSASTDTHRPHVVYQKQQHTTTRQQSQPSGRRSSHQYRNNIIDERQPPLFQSTTSCAVPSVTTNSAPIPPGSPEDTLSPETRTAQWVLNSIPKTPSGSGYTEGVAPERSSSSTMAPKDVRTCEKRQARNSEKLSNKVDTLNTQLEQKNKQLNDANCRESNLLREIRRLQETLKVRNALVVRHEETITNLQRNIRQMQAPPPTPISPNHPDNYSYIDDVTDHPTNQRSGSNGVGIIDILSSTSTASS